jgi:SAM-dependent methyltransferase
MYKVKDVILSLRKTIFLNPIWLLERTFNIKITELILACNIKYSEQWLDVGCGTRPYEYLFPEGVYVGVDVEESGRGTELKSPDYFYDGKTLPFPDDCFDGVISTEVLEHVPDPQLYLHEAARVLKPGGSLILSVPFVFGEHESPFDFFRFSQFGLTKLLTKSGFIINRVVKDPGAIITIAMLTNVYIGTNISPKIKIKGAGLAFSFVFCFPIQALSLILSRILPDQNNLYMNILVKAVKSSS